MSLASSRLAHLLGEIKRCDEAQKNLSATRRGLVHAVMSMKDKASKVLQRFEAGEYIVSSSGRHFWCTEGKGPTQPVYKEEMEGLEELGRMGVIVKE